MSSLAMVALHFSRQVPVVANVHYCVTSNATPLEILRNLRTVDAAHQVLDIAFPFVAADGDTPEIVHVADDCVTQVAAVVTIIVDFAEKVLLSDLLDVCIDLLLDVLNRDVFVVVHAESACWLLLLSLGKYLLFIHIKSISIFKENRSTFRPYKPYI